MNLVLLVLLVPLSAILFIIYCIITSKGECYYCGHKFERSDVVFKKRDTAKVVKCCGDCRSSF